MKKLPLLLLSSALFTLPAVAQAEWYAGAGGGVQFLRDYDVKTAVKQEVNSNTGWGALGAIGYKYGNGLRSELELSFRNADVDSISGSPFSSGSTRTYGLMVNTLYDIETGMGFTPYLGGGLGVAKVSYDNLRIIGGSRLDDSNKGFAVQGIGGFSVPVMEAVSFFTQYQYQHIFDIDANTDSGMQAKSDMGNHLITAGLRWEFGGPEAMKPLVPVVVEEPAPVKEEVVAAPAIEKYMVFFDFDRSDLTIEAAAILKKVAENAQKGKVSRLELTGHADRAGSDAYNMKLSERRAATVQKQLIRLGMPADEITTTAKGEREPLVATNDGVREPQNRRVEIVYGK